MAKTFEQGKAEIVNLVRYFSTNRAAFHEPSIREADVCASLIEPFFVALGWDVRNTEMVAPQNREVIPQEKLDDEGHSKSPDYAFRARMTPKFYTEAKKPSTNIKDDPGPAYQLRRYAWSAKLPLSILTNFKEFAVFEGSTRPAHSDKANKARIWYFTFDEYEGRWREIWDVFSYVAVLGGQFDQFAGSKKGKRPTATVDAEFLKEIEGWRESLARNMALRNPRLSHEDLNKAVQLTIDRIIFLRMAEDRGIEQEERLWKLAQEPEIYRRFMKDVCRRADDKYNSGLFHFDEEPGVESEPDKLTPRLVVDDKVLKPILTDLYFPSPYAFQVLPVEILGNIYEQFLGKVIRLTKGHQAKVEEKPEVRKAGGVYYTPVYIVDYIVENTVGAMIDGKSPAQLAGKGKGQPLRILDMACGSGSFLLGAYQYLLSYCLKWYLENGPEKYSKAVWQANGQGAWRLTIGERKRILTTHIFAVDIDPQAVEVTKLSLLLKVLEGETDESLGKQTQGRLFDDRALPNLDENIKCGNSLIGTDCGFFADDEERTRIKPFNWKIGFPAAMTAGGFDCVIGNPPYVRIQTMKEWAPSEVEIYKDIYRSAKVGNYDVYVVFVERGLQLLAQRGRLGFILPHKFFNARYGEALREMVAEGRHLSHVVHFGHQQVFDGATTYTCLLFLDKAGKAECRFAKVDDLEAWRNSGQAIEGRIPAAKIASAEWNFTVGPNSGLCNKLASMPVKLGDAADIFVGLQTSADDVFIMDLVRETAKTFRLKSKSLDAEWTFEKDLFFPLVSGTDVNSYAPLPNRQYILFPYRVLSEQASLIAMTEIQERFPKTAAYLLENRDRLEDREKGSFRGPGWHRFGRSQNLGIQERRKICVPRLVEGLHAGYDRKGAHFLDNVDVGGVVFKAQYQSQSLEYLLALLNSRLLRWYFPSISAPFRGGWRSANRQFLSQLPFRAIDLSDESDKARHGRMVGLVEQMLRFHKSLQETDSEQSRDVLQHQIDATDAEIDRLVYDLYGLTEEEIKLVERSAP